MAVNALTYIRRHLAQLNTVGGLLALRITAAAHRLPEVRLRHEFNRSAEKGLGANMERDHLRVTERALDKMNLTAADRVLDLECGEGRACRLIAERVGHSGRIVGLDVSDEMMRVANTKSAQFEQVTYVCGSADRISCPTGYFTKVLSVASFIVFEDQEKVLEELFRVLAPGGELFIHTYLYKGRPGWITMARDIAWESRTGMSLHVYSADEYTSMLKAGAWVDVHTEEWLSDEDLGHVDDDHYRVLLIRARTPSSSAEKLRLRTLNFH